MKVRPQLVKRNRSVPSARLYSTQVRECEGGGGSFEYFGIELTKKSSLVSVEMCLDAGECLALKL